MNNDTGISRAPVGLARSPVHSYTPTARTTFFGSVTLCVCACIRVAKESNARAQSRSPARDLRADRELSGFAGSGLIRGLDVRSALPVLHQTTAARPICSTIRLVSANQHNPDPAGHVGESPLSREPVLRVEDLTIAFGGREAVRNVSLAIAPGETLGLVGESGSGKSATSLALLSLLPPQARVAGRVW